MKKKLASMILAAGMALTLAACGGGSTQSESKAASTSAAVSAASGESSGTAAAGSFKTAEDGKLHMATNAQFPPYESTTDDGGFTGIDIDIATAIAEKLNLELVVDDMDFGSVVTSAGTGKSDIAMAGLTVSEERKKSVSFTDTYWHGVQAIVVPQDSDIKTADDLANATGIGCQEGTTGYTLCSDSYGDKAIAYQDGATAVQAMKSGKVDAVVIDNEPAKAYVKANPELKVLDTPFTDEEYAIGVSKDNPELLAAVNGALQELTKDGTVQKIIDQYIAK